MMKKTICLLALVLCFLSAQAQDRSDIEKKISAASALADSHNWSEAFKLLRDVDGSIGGSHPELHYLVSKERFVLYRRISHAKEAKENLERMETLAKRSGDKQVMEDMLMTKAAYLNSTGSPQEAQACYKEIFYMRSKGADIDGTEKCFQTMIAEAQKKKNSSMDATLSKMYSSWQDSIAGVRAATELKKVQKERDTLQETLDSRETKISIQWGTIAFLSILVIALAAGLLFFIFLNLKKMRTTKRLRADLKLSNENNAQKTLFIQNISKQITPSLVEIARGSRHHIGALQSMLQHIEHYMELETAPAEQFETTQEDIAKFCQEVLDDTNCESIPVNIDTQKMSFPLAKEVLKELLSSILHEATVAGGTERMTLGFKKRNPHTGQFIVTAVGLKYSEEDREQLFTAFSKVFDLSVTDGLTYPTCALMAHKMGGSLSLDPEFVKGTRFVVEIHC